MNDKRNWKIYFEWIDGKTYNELAQEFDLSHGTIKEICHEKIPPKVKANAGLRINSYKKFRDWYKKKRYEEDPRES